MADQASLQVIGLMLAPASRLSLHWSLLRRSEQVLVRSKRRGPMPAGVFRASASINSPLNPANDARSRAKIGADAS